MRTLSISLMLGLLCCPVFNQVPSSKVQVGVCIDLDKLEAAQAAGFDYLEVSLSRVAALTQDEFEQLAKRVRLLRIPVAAANSVND